MDMKFTFGNEFHGWDQALGCDGLLCRADRLSFVQFKVEAVKWYRKAIEQGIADSQFGLSLSYQYSGQGVTPEKVEAVKCLRKAAEQGDANAQFCLGLYYVYSQGVTADKVDGCWPETIRKVKNVLRGGVTKDTVEAVKWYHKAAEQGHAEAQFNLGRCYLNGRGVTQDNVEAVKWLRKAAEQGHADAQFNLGRSYLNGHGVTQDDVEAVKWLRKAAERGDADAQFCLGSLYEDGLGVTPDEVEAVKWYRKAAEQGHAAAQCKLDPTHPTAIKLGQ